MAEKTVRLISPRGFCAGVRGALNAFERARKNNSGTIYVLNELVHNRRVGSEMLRQGAVFVKSLDEVPDGSTLLFGAHGVGRNEEETARRKALNVIDAGCPRVKRLHHAAAELTGENDLVIFGNPDHPEIRGVAGHSNAARTFILNTVEEISALPELHDPVLLSQTTRDHLEIETFTAALKERFPALSAKGKVCDAVYRRQQAVEAAAQDADLIIIAGSPHSSNARRMCEIARRMGKESLLIDTVSELPDISGFDRIALSAGASTPDPAVQEILARLTELGWKLLS